MSALDDLIAAKELHVASFGAGTANQPAPLSKEYFQLRAAVVSLAYLRRVKEVEGDIAAAERVYKSALREAKSE